MTQMKYLKLVLQRTLLPASVLAGLLFSTSLSNVLADDGPNSSLYSSRMVAAQEVVPPGPTASMGGSFQLGGQSPVRPRADKVT